MSKKQGTDAAPAAPEAKTTAPAPKAAKRDAASSSGAGETKGGLGARIREFRDYLVLSRVELRKVSCPTGKKPAPPAWWCLGSSPLWPSFSEWWT